MHLKIYDGAEGIGGTKIYLGHENHGIFLDFGLNFATYGKYFKEFLGMRAIRGLNDPLEMGLLPPIDAYREDLYPSDLHIPHLEKIPVNAVLITHAHMDHYGMMGYLSFHIPIVASPETLAIIKAYQDAGKADNASSIIYAAIREEVTSSVPVLKSMGNNIRSNEEKIRKYLRIRKIIPTESLSKEEKEFLYLQSNQRREEYLRENMEFGKLASLPFRVNAHPVGHSIYGAVGYIVNMDFEHESVRVAYTGDFRVHGERAEKTKEFVRRARGSNILIIEGTRVSEKKHRHTTEMEVLENCSAAVGEERKLVVADFSARNFERLNIFAKIARENGRKLVVTEKDAYAIKGLLSTGTIIELSDIWVYDKPKDSVGWWQKKLMQDELWEDRYVSPGEIRESPGEYILAFSLYDMPNLMDIKSYGGTYLYSSTEALSEDAELDFKTLSNWLKKYGIRSVGFFIDADGKPQFEEGYHASGHASGEEIYEFIAAIDPEIIIPVHTANPTWFSHNFDNALILRNGESLNF